MKTKILAIDKSNDVINNALNILGNSGVVAFPTETVYGLGADYSDELAIKKIFDVKGRSFAKPLAAHIASLEQVPLLCRDIPDDFYKLAKAFLPGPISIVLKKKKSVSNLLTAGFDTLAIRFPDNEIAIELINRYGKPLAATSANISGRKSPINAEDVYEELREKIPLIIDGGETSCKLESTVISLIEQPKILRPGAVRIEAIEDTLGQIIAK